MRSRGPAVWVALVALIVAIAAACGDSGGNFSDGGSGQDGTISFPEAGFNPDSGLLTISPLNQTLNVTYGQPQPMVTYQAAWNGTPVAASFSIDRGELADVNAATGVLTPKATLGGSGIVTASYQGYQASTPVTILLTWTQNGDPSAGDAGGGSGGAGGVGGEGPGGPVSGSTLTVLQGTPVADPGLAWLYPYDATVWPRGLLAPLLQWAPGAAASYDAIYIHAHEKALDYKGYFAKTATPFIHHPIPQAAWHALNYSNQGEDLVVDIVLSKGNVAYGPITETWKIANGSLKGTVYYNSYGTALAKNYCCAFNGSTFGGATLAIKGGSTSPVLVAGTNGGSPQCRVCHSVAADGSGLVTQHGDDYAASSQYDLKNNNLETGMSPADYRYAFPALSPDGAFLFSNSSPLPGVNNTAASALFQVPSGTPIAATGLPGGLRAGMPVFSPDGKHVAFNYYSSDQKSLAVMDFAANAFSNLTVLDTPSGSFPDLYPSYLPTNDAVVYERETASDGEFGATRNGSRGELWWVTTASPAPTRLDKLNGAGYLPSGVNNHNADTTLNYEPTVAPVVAGGYAWVVFTSRRMYGNVATIDPFWSDPRDHDISATPTTKKLWVAAIDVNAPAGTDPSHPAFYLPAQELLAGNSRGYWVVDPCKQDGNSCDTGDECCGGYCHSSDGGLVCSSTTGGCSAEYDKCTTNADCCGTGSLVCINGRCAQKTPN